MHRRSFDDTNGFLLHTLVGSHGYSRPIMMKYCRLESLDLEHSNPQPEPAPSTVDQKRVHHRTCLFPHPENRHTIRNRMRGSTEPKTFKGSLETRKHNGWSWLLAEELRDPEHTFYRIQNNPNENRKNSHNGEEKHHKRVTNGKFARNIECLGNAYSHQG